MNNLLDRKEAVVGGVCSRLAQDYDLDVRVVRLVATLLLVFMGTLAVLFYGLIYLFFKKANREAIDRFVVKVSRGTLNYEAVEFLLLASLLIIAIETFIFSVWF